MSNSDTCVGENKIEFGNSVTGGGGKILGRVDGKNLSEEVMFRLT